MTTKLDEHMVIVSLLEVVKYCINFQPKLKQFEKKMEKIFPKGEPFEIFTKFSKKFKNVHTVERRVRAHQELSDSSYIFFSSF